MYKIVIKGGKRLAGEVSVSGAKNAALPILASSLLARGQSIYRNVPGLGDVLTMRKLLGTARRQGERATAPPSSTPRTSTTSRRPTSW